MLGDQKDFKKMAALLFYFYINLEIFVALYANVYCLKIRFKRYVIYMYFDRGKKDTFLVSTLFNISSLKEKKCQLYAK